MGIEKLDVKGGEDTPNVLFDNETKTLKISGKSFPDNVIEFYNPIINWLKDYAESPFSQTNVILSFDYFNTASAKVILDILQVLGSIHKKGAVVDIKWLYDKDDEDMEQAGHRYSKVANIPMKVEPK